MSQGQMVEDRCTIMNEIYEKHGKAIWELAYKELQEKTEDCAGAYRHARELQVAREILERLGGGKDDQP